MKTSKIARYTCLLAVLVMAGCSPLRTYTKSGGFEYMQNSGSGQIIGKSPDNGFTTELAVIAKIEKDTSLSKIDDTIKIPLSFVFAPKDLRVNAEKTNVKLGFAPSYQILAEQPYSKTADIVAPKQMLSPSQENRVVFSELHTGKMTEIWGGSATIGTTVGDSRDWDFSIEGDARKRTYDDLLIGYKLKVLKPIATSQISLKKGQSVIDPATDTAIKFESIFQRGNDLVANIHVIPNQGSLGLNHSWSDNPANVQRVRLGGSEGKLANGGLAWNSVRGLQPLGQTEVALPLEASQSANEVAVIYISEKEFLVIRLEQLRSGGTDAVISLQKVAVR